MDKLDRAIYDKFDEYYHPNAKRWAIFWGIIVLVEILFLGVVIYVVAH